MTSGNVGTMATGAILYTFLLLLLVVWIPSCTAGKWLAYRVPIFPSRPPWSKKKQLLSKPYEPSLLRLSGGEIEGSTDSLGKQDGERYSRQVYTLGARAHGLVRAATIFLDGPSSSGLLYECGKNLALSGVGHIVVLTSDVDGEEPYHNAPLDDLGQAYERAARTELGYEPDDDATSMDILTEYLQRLNPSIDVSKMARTDLDSKKDLKGCVLLCVDRPQSSKMQLNAFCREQNIPFVAVETAGVYGHAFCDFGPSFEVFDADGEAPLVVPLDHVESTEDGILVCCVEGEKHDVSRGDQIVFQNSHGDSLEESCTVSKVQTPERLIISCSSMDGSPSKDFLTQVNDVDIVSFSRVKIAQEHSFMPLATALKNCKEDDSLFVPCDFDKSLDAVRKFAILCCFEAKQQFLELNGQLPKKSDLMEFAKIARNCVAAKENIVATEQWKKILSSFISSCPAKLTPIQCMFGAIGAQEALKATTGLYNPVNQFLLYDCDELLDSPVFDTKHMRETSIAAPGLAYIFGQSLAEKLASSRLFVVGAGAIGCELLKNLAAMGAGTGTGRIVVTDMDTIERSNLSRQFLFRDIDIGKFKSRAAHDAVLKFNPAINMEVHTSKVGEDHGPFDDLFWSEGIDIILNALDNVEARLFVDGQSVAHRKALIDAGTLGSKGNVQVIVPGQSESYGSSVDPPEPAIPVCTLKNFPYAITHTIQWGRDLFDGLFQRRPTQANEYADRVFQSNSRDFSEQLVEKLGADAAVEAAIELAEDLGVQPFQGAQNSYQESAIAWAIDTARRLFHENIHEILRQHPRDSVDEDGEPFWSGTRRLPKALSFSTSGKTDAHQALVNENLIEFVRVGARLRIETLFQETDSNEEAQVSLEDAVSFLSKADWSHTPVEERDEAEGDAIAKVDKLVNEIDRREDTCTSKMGIIEFEKDNVTNGHVAFVTAASNLRALCYGIAPVDAMETRRVAGKVVPAMITTTAFVSGLSCIELLKLLQEVPLQLHRNGFINLALPFFAFTAPLPAEEIPGLQGECFTLWDRIIVREGKKSAESGGMTLRRFLRRIRKKAASTPDSIDIVTLAYGPYMIYANFLHEDDEDILDRPLIALLKSAIVSGDEFDEEFSREGSSSTASTSTETEGLECRSFLDLTAVVEEQESGDEIELPPVRFVKWRSR